MTTLLLIAAMLLPSPIQRAEDLKPAHPQYAREKSQEEAEPRPLPSNELTITYYRPRRLAAAEAASVAEQLFGDYVYVVFPTTPGQPVGADWIPHFLVVENVLLIRDTAEQGKRISSELARLEDALVPPPAPGEGSGSSRLVDFEYEPRFVDVRLLDLALERFRAPVRSSLSGGGSMEIANIATLSERNLILVKETKERAAEIRAFLERLDTPAPQVTVSYIVLQGAEQADPSTPALPGVLTDNLRKLVPFQNFRVLSSGVLRGSARAKMQTEIEAEVGPPSLDLELDPASFDPQSKTLTLRRCYFGTVVGGGHRTLETAASLRAGEFTVIGATGRDAVFLVLRLTLE